MSDERQFATPEEVKARQERIRLGIAKMRELAVRKQAIFERWEDEGLLPREKPRRRF